jgi:hypothetical protein
MASAKRIGLGLISLLVAAAVWLQCVHLVHAPRVASFFRPGGVAPQARRLAARHLRLWSEPALREREVAVMRARNAEWDFMGRTFLAAGLANLALRDPDGPDRRRAQPGAGRRARRRGACARLGVPACG